MADTALHNYWKKHVDSKFLYRIVSKEYIPQIRKSGLNPRKNPFNPIKKDIYKLFDILLILKKKGFLVIRWWGRPVDQAEVIRVTKKDLKKNFIDFTPNTHNQLKYYLNLRGGALVSTILIFTNEVLKRKPDITEKQLKLVKKLNKWAKHKSKFKNKIIRIKASSKHFEGAHFQIRDIKKYSQSPFGSFNNFEKAINRKGLNFYKPYLEGKLLFYLRTTKPIPPKEIKF